MPRFYFDSDDGEHMLVDDEGQEMPSFLAAREEAIRALPNIARDMLPDGDERTFISIIRDVGGKQIFKASLVFRWTGCGSTVVTGGTLSLRTLTEPSDAAPILVRNFGPNRAACAPTHEATPRPVFLAKYVIKITMVGKAGRWKPRPDLPSGG